MAGGAGDAAVLQDHQVELAEPFGVGEELDLDDSCESIGHILGRVLS
jgi:hypothetical protein